EAVAEVAPRLATVSAERIGAELTRVLLAPGAAPGLRLSEQLDLLDATLPELGPLVGFAGEGSKDLWTHTLRVVAQTPARAVARWAALLHDVAKPRTYSVDADGVHFIGHEAAGARIVAERELARLQSPLDGNGLMQLFGRPPGPWIRPLKDYLRDLVIDGALAPDDREGATRLAERWMAERK